MNAAGNIVSTITSIQIQSANVIAITPCLEECESEVDGELITNDTMKISDLQSIFDDTKNK